jgi:purine-nucleoside phosphorylase
MPRTKRTADLFSRINKAVQSIWSHTAMRPDIAIILGTGLGNLTKKIKKEATISYKQIPNFPTSTVASHAGRLVFGTLAGKRVVVMDGRFHHYEGYSMEQVTFPIRVLRKLGGKVLIVSNAAGGMNLDYKKGDIAVISDHINLMGVNPLIGPNDDRLGIRFPDLSEPYSKRLLQIAAQVAKKQGIALRKSVYVGVSGPNLETPAEYRFLRGIGADVVGMSTVPEVLVGIHAGFEILGFSVVTDLCDPDNLKPVNIEEIIQTANQAGPVLDQLVKEVVQNIPDVH